MTSFKQLAREWSWRAFSIHLPVTIFVVGFLLAIGTVAMFRSPTQNSYTVDPNYRNVRFSPRDYLVQSNTSTEQRTENSQLLPRLSPYNKTFPMDFNIIFEPHVHTTFSDGRLNLEKMLEWAMAMGYNAIALTDHNTIGGIRRAVQLSETDDRFRGKIVVLPGMEYSSCRIHMNIIGASFPYNASELEALNATQKAAVEFLLDTALERPVPSDEDIQKVIESAHILGAVVSVNHIPWSSNTLPTWSRGAPTLPNHPTREQLLEWGADFIEVVNGDTFDLTSVQFVESIYPQMGMLSGADMHYPVPTQAWTIMKTANLSREAIMTELRAKRTTFLFDAAGIPASLLGGESLNVYGQETGAYTVNTPLAMLGEYAGMFYDHRSAMPSFQGTMCAASVTRVYPDRIGWFVLQAILFFIMFEVLFFLLWTFVFPWIRTQWLRCKQIRPARVTSDADSEEPEVATVTQQNEEHVK